MLDETPSRSARSPVRFARSCARHERTVFSRESTVYVSHTPVRTLTLMRCLVCHTHAHGHMDIPVPIPRTPPPASTVLSVLPMRVRTLHPFNIAAYVVPSPLGWSI
eukprot:6172355-Pleurochrysis_carterae.AAC.2